MDELELGKQAFLKLVAELDDAVDVVIPTSASRDLFLIALSKGPNRQFIQVPEDDILDLPEEDSVRQQVADMVREAVALL